MENAMEIHKHNWDKMNRATATREQINDKYPKNSQTNERENEHHHSKTMVNEGCVCVKCCRLLYIHYIKLNTKDFCVRKIL